MILFFFIVNQTQDKEKKDKHLIYVSSTFHNYYNNNILFILSGSLGEINI